MESKTLPDGYLETCSLDALESLMLARKNVAMNFFVEMRRLLELWVQAEMDAKLAEWMLGIRRSQALRAGGTARLSPGKQLAGRVQRVLSEPATNANEAPPAKRTVRQSVSPIPVPRAPLARIASQPSHRKASAAPVVDELRRQQPPSRVRSRALLPAAAAGGEIQPSPNTQRAGTPRSTAVQELREVLDLLPTDPAIAAVQATSRTNKSRRGLDPSVRGATKPLPERVRLVSAGRLSSAHSNPTRAPATKLVAGRRCLAPAS